MKMQMMKKTIKEAIVVEGRDDTAAINRAVNAVTIETHGFGMPEHIWPVIEKAYKEKGVIIFTDPDYAGEKIRKKVAARFPECKQAFLPKGKALKKGNVGVENAKPEDIVEALEKARCTDVQKKNIYTMDDLYYYGLIGADDAAAKREALGNLLSIGYGNGKSFLKKLNQFQVPKEELEKKLEEI